jgi:hypothetical protein
LKRLVKLGEDEMKKYSLEIEALASLFSFYSYHFLASSFSQKDPSEIDVLLLCRILTFDAFDRSSNLYSVSQIFSCPPKSLIKMTMNVLKRKIEVKLCHLSGPVAQFFLDGQLQMSPGFNAFLNSYVNGEYCDEVICRLSKFIAKIFLHISVFDIKFDILL